MNKNIKKLILFLIISLLLPTMLYFIFSFGNFLGYKNYNLNNEDSKQNTSQVPQENKKPTTIPSAEDKKNENKNIENNSQEENNKFDKNAKLNNAIEENIKIVKGTEYTVKAGDSLFSISIKAYGDSNHQEGMDKIRNENNIKNNELQVGQKIKIPE